MSSPDPTVPQGSGLDKETEIAPPRTAPDGRDVVQGDEKFVPGDDSNEASDSSDAQEFKEGGYGWACVFAVGMINAHTWGMNSAYAVFLAYYLHSDAFPGASPIAFAFVGGLSISMALLVSPLATTTIRLYGTRATLLIGVVFETIAFIGASFTTAIWHLVLSQGIAFGLGMGFLFTGSVGIVPQWFTTRRSFANALATSGTGIGGIIYSLGTNAMIKNIGLPWAFRILAIVAFFVNGICSIIIRDRNKVIGAVHVAFHSAVFKKIEFYLFLVWGSLSLLSYIIVVFSLADYAQVVGFSASQGSIVAACFNVSQAVGRPVIGLISDRVGRINVAALGTLVASLAAFFLWIFAGKYYAGLIVYSLFGCSAGILWAVVAPVGAEVFGLQILPSALSVTWLIMVLPATFAEVIAVALRKKGSDGYLHVQLLAAILYLAAFASGWSLRVWKLHEEDVLGLTKEQREIDVRNPDEVMNANQPNDDTPRGKVYTASSMWRATYRIQRV